MGNQATKKKRVAGRQADRIDSMDSMDSIDRIDG